MKKIYALIYLALFVQQLSCFPVENDREEGKSNRRRHYYTPLSSTSIENSRDSSSFMKSIDNIKSLKKNEYQNKKRAGAVNQEEDNCIICLVSKPNCSPLCCSKEILCTLCALKIYNNGNSLCPQCRKPLKLKIIEK